MGVQRLKVARGKRVPGIILFVRVREEAIVT